MILGFCLYLCDRDDLFKIACEVDRILQNNGYIIILDFNTPFAYRNNYVHCTGLYSYKMVYSKMFSWNPHYTVSFRKIFTGESDDEKFNINERRGVTILKKSIENAYLEEPLGK